MKHIYLILSCLILVKFSISQDTIDVKSLPQAGLTYIVSKDTSTQYSISAASQSAQSWDFSNLVEAYPKVPTYDSTSKTSFGSSFPTSNLFTYGPAAMYSGLFGSTPVDVQGTNKGYMFWRADSTGFWSEGFRSDNGVYSNKIVKIQPSELIFPLPGILNDSTSHKSSWMLSFNQNTANVDTFYVTKSEKHFKYDAFGNIKTPYGNFTKVLRLHEYAIKVDSVYSTLNGNTVYTTVLKRDTTNTYYYFGKDTDYPVLTSYADKNNNLMFTEYFKMTVPSTMQTSIFSPVETFSVYPNPTNSVLHLKTELEIFLVEIFSIEGKRVKEEIIDKNRETISIAELKPGIYFCKIQSFDGKKQSTIKVIKN
ncbi:MAG: T9SS type A sorting domain-containing protein [Chitinophagales bacterium]|nr:T9SS type A sorting domain-containing protein [Chitinophagales bacterium]